LDGVRLRPLREADDTRVVEACSDPMSAQWLGTLPVPFGLGDAVAWREHRQLAAAQGTALTWAISGNRDQLLGAISLSGVTEQPGARGEGSELGYWVHPDARRCGVATLAARAVVRHALLP